MKPISVACGLLALAPTLAQAGDPGFLDLYYIPSADLKIDISGFGSADDSGEGYGLRGAMPLSANAALTAEYQSSDYDDFDLGYNQLRAGFAVFVNETTGIIVEYVDAELEDPGGDAPADGFAGHLHVGIPASQTAELYGRVGYVKLEDDDNDEFEGLEYSVGTMVSLNPALSAFFDFRSTDLESSDGSVDMKFDDLRIGLRILLN